MERLDWDDAKVFLALARAGTLSGAAQRLAAGVATVSRRAERLEAAMGLPLFLRHQSGYRLTDQGRALLPRFEAAEAAMLGLSREAGRQGEVAGHVRIASVESLVSPIVVPALAPLLAAHPGLDVEVLFHTVTLNLNQRDTDLALRMMRPVQGHLVTRRLGEMAFGLYGPPDGSRPARHVTWAEDDSLSVVLGWARAFGAGEAPRFAANTLAAQVRAVAEGIGLSVLPHHLARPERLRLLSDRLPGGEAMRRDLWLVTHADLSGSARVRAVSDCLADALHHRRPELTQP